MLQYLRCWRIGVSLHTATHNNTLHHTATHCNTLQHTATHHNTLQHTATHCNTHCPAPPKSQSNAAVVNMSQWLHRDNGVPGLRREEVVLLNTSCLMTTSPLLRLLLNKTTSIQQNYFYTSLSKTYSTRLLVQQAQRIQQDYFYNKTTSTRLA